MISYYNAVFVTALLLLGLLQFVVRNGSSSQKKLVFKVVGVTSGIAFLLPTLLNALTMLQAALLMAALAGLAGAFIPVTELLPARVMMSENDSVKVKEKSIPEIEKTVVTPESVSREVPEVEMFLEMNQDNVENEAPVIIETEYPIIHEDAAHEDAADVIEGELITNEEVISDEIVSIEDAVEEVVSEEVVGVESESEEDLSKDIAPEVEVREEVEPEEAVSEVVVGEKDVSEEVITEESITEEVITEEVITDEVITEEVITEDDVPEDDVPKEVIIEEVIAEEVIAEEVITDEVITEDDVPEEVKVDAIEPVKVLTEIPEITIGDTQVGQMVSEVPGNIVLPDVFSETMAEIMLMNGYLALKEDEEDEAVDSFMMVCKRAHVADQRMMAYMELKLLMPETGRMPELIHLCDEMLEGDFELTTLQVRYIEKHTHYLKRLVSLLNAHGVPVELPYSAMPDELKEMAMTYQK